MTQHAKGTFEVTLAPQLTITVVPDSGTGALAGIAETFGIDIVDGKHFYRFEYTLPL